MSMMTRRCSHCKQVFAQNDTCTSVYCSLPCQIAKDPIDADDGSKPVKTPLDAPKGIGGKHHSPTPKNAS